MGLSPVLHPSAAGRKVPAPPPCAGCQPLDGEAHVTQGQPSSLPFEGKTFIYLRTKKCIKYLGELKEESGDQEAIPWSPEEQDGAVHHCFFLTLIFSILSQNYRKSSRHLAAFISKFVQFIHKYITCNAQAAVSFLQKHSDPLQ